MDRTEVVFFGSGAFGVPTLERLAITRGLAAIVTQPDRKAGRGGKMTPTPVGEWAADHAPDVPLLKPERVADPDVIERVRVFPVSAWVVIAYGQKLPPELLAKKFAVNLHASRLPRWRGAAPINWAILAGDETTGNSVITLADRMDAGLVLAQSERPIDPEVTTGELHDLLAQDGPDLVAGVLDQHDRDALEPVTQDESLVTHARKLSRNDSPLDWNKSAIELAHQINGLNPWPSATTRLANETIKLLRARPIAAPSDLEEARLPFWIFDLPGEEHLNQQYTNYRTDAGFEPGAIFHGRLGLVWTGEGILQILEAQAHNKAVMAWNEFANGRGLHSSDCVNPKQKPLFVTLSPQC